MVRGLSHGVLASSFIALLLAHANASGPAPATGAKPSAPDTPASSSEQFVGASGTDWWVDPKEELVVVYLSAAPGPIRWHYRQKINALVYQAMIE